MAKLHQGQVSERDVKSASARVAMDDLGGTVSGKMQVLFPAIGGWNCFWTPKVGDHAVFEKLANGSQEGYILGKVYTANKMPQGGKPNIILIVSDDGKNFVCFNADTGTLDLVCDKKATLKFENLDIEVKEHTQIKTKTFFMEVEESAEIEVGENADITVGEDMTIGVGNDMTTDVGGNITTDAAENITVTAGGEHRDDGATVQHN